VETDEHGNILERMELPLPRTEIEKQAWWVSALHIVGDPPAYGWMKLIALQTAKGPRRTRALAEWIGIGFVCAIVAIPLLRPRHQTRGTKIVWMLIASLMGISGVLLLLSLRQRVATVRCPSCGKQRLVTRQTCEHCQAPFAEPARQGIEIFELV
jgi:predicted amidophosphoribosyltransferase